MTEENISYVQILKRFKKHYLVPTSHNIVLESITINGVDLDKKLVKVHYEILRDDEGHIDVIIPQEKYVSYFISYRIEGNFKRIIVKQEDYVHCKEIGGEYNFIFDNEEVS